MAINLKKLFREWNESEITRYEKLIEYTKKSTLKNKHIKTRLRHIQARSNQSILIELYSKDSHLDFLRELKRHKIIKRIR